MKWTNVGHEFDTVAKKLLDRKTTYRLWGAAQLGKDFFERLSEKVNIVQVVDGDAKKHGSLLGNVIIEAPSQLVYDEASVVVVTCSYYEENRPAIQSLGYVPMENLFYYEDFYILYDLYTNNFLRSKRIDFSLTEKCTLKCKKCNMFMTHFKTPAHQPLEDVLQDLDVYFAVVDYVKVLNLLGGEPFLYPDLDKVLDYIAEHYRSRIERVIIFTNGTLLPKQPLVESIKKCRATVQFSDYTNTVPYQERLHQFKELVEQENIENYTMANDEWGDFGFPENPNCMESDEEATCFFERCKAPFRGIWKKRVYFCHLETSAIRAGLFEDESNDYFDLTATDNRMMKKQYCEFDYGYSKKGFIAFCKVCRGCDCVNDLTVPAAEQL